MPQKNRTQSNAPEKVKINLQSLLEEIGGSTIEGKRQSLQSSVFEE